MEVTPVVESVLGTGVLLGGGVEVVGLAEAERLQRRLHHLHGTVDLVGVEASAGTERTLGLLCIRGHKGKTDPARVPNVEKQLMCLGLDRGGGGGGQLGFLCVRG